MKCTNCENEVPDTAKVCGYCGHQLKAAEPQLSPPASPLRIDGLKRKPSVWIWAVAGIGALVLFVIILVFGIALFFPLQIDLGTNPDTTIPLQTNPTSTMIPEEVQTPAAPSQEPGNTEVSIIVNPFNGEDIPRLAELSKEETNPNNTNTWEVTISSATSVSIGWAWCASTQEILDQNLQHMKFQFFVDGLDVMDSMTQFQGPIEGGICHIYRGVIRSWPRGRHTILYKMIFLQKVNDGEKDYEGENIKTYFVNVSP